MTLEDDEKVEIERRAVEHGEARAKFKQLELEHVEILKFVRDYRVVLDKIYASKMTEIIVNTVLKVVLLAVLAGGLALVVRKP
jgi:hypothetical protein